MIDHITVGVKDYARSKAFYEKALAPLGWKVLMEFGPSAGFGDNHPHFWIAQRGDASGSVHVALRANDHATVDAFHKAALAAGGKDNGAPGIRAQYSPSYYAAFVFDPDGNNVEAVNHG